MSWIRRHLSRPSPALVISIIALVLALGGSGYAAIKLPKNSVGTRQIKNNAVTGAKVKNGSLTGKDIKLTALGTVPAATNATNAANATHAGSADNATNAGNSSTVGGNTVRAFSLIAPSSAAEAKVLDLDGLQLFASCTAGAVTLTARTTTADSEISAYSRDASSGSDTQDYNDTFSPGDSFVLPQNSHSDEIGQGRFSGADGHFVDFTYNEEDIVGGNECYAHGFAFGN